MRALDCPSPFSPGRRHARSDGWRALFHGTRRARACPRLPLECLGDLIRAIKRDDEAVCGVIHQLGVWGILQDHLVPILHTYTSDEMLGRAAGAEAPASCSGRMWSRSWVHAVVPRATQWHESDSRSPRLAPYAWASSSSVRLMVYLTKPNPPWKEDVARQLAYMQAQKMCLLDGATLDIIVGLLVSAIAVPAAYGFVVASTS